MRWRFLAFVVGAGCGGSPAGGDAYVPDASSIEGDRIGQVAIANWALQGTQFEPAQHGSYVRAQFGIDGLPNPAIGDPLSVVMTAGDCRLLKNLPTTCVPACEDLERCHPDGTCRSANNFGLDAGPVTVAGAHEPIEVSFHEGYGFGAAENLVDPGAVISVSAGGGTWDGTTVAGFDLSGVAPEELDLTIPGDALLLSDNAATVLAWTASTHDDAHYELRIQEAYLHGGRPDTVLACDGADTGGISIAPELIAMLPALEAPECFGLTCVYAHVQRFTRTSIATADGTVELTIGGIRYFEVEH